MNGEKLARELIEAADEARYENPRRALQRALCARDFAASLEESDLEASSSKLPEGERHRRWLALQADAWAVLGSAHRCVGDLPRAEGVLLVALAFLDAHGESGDDPRRRARLAQRAGYVRCDQGRFDEALDLFRQAGDWYREVGAMQRAASTRVDLAVVLRRAGQSGAAIAELAAALDVLDRDAEPRSQVAAVHNMAQLLLETARDAGEEAEALRWLDLACREHERSPETVNVLRLRAVAALTSARLGRPRAACQELEELAERFGEIGAACDQALVLLHLAELTLAANEHEPDRRIDQVLKLTGRLFPLLGRVALGEDAKDALLRLLAGARRRELSVEVIRHTAGLVEQSLSVG